MKVHSLVLASLLTTTMATFAQKEPLHSPVIEGDSGAVTFQMAAGKADQVILRGQWDRKKTPMIRGGNGVWRVTVEDLPTGIWGYSFVVDGVSMVDPLNPAIKPMRNPKTSILHLPSDPPAPWDFVEVPHGSVHRHGFSGKAAKGPREVWVYTPPGYETATDQTFPLLVLQHGSGDNQKTWVEHGKAHWILDNLISEGAAVPMVVAMIDGHPLGKVPWNDEERRAASLRAFESELLNEALPLVESLYRVSKNREDRGIAGLSMGGWQSVSVGLNHLDRFAWIGSFSGAVNRDEVRAALDDPDGTNASLKLLWIACGKDDFLLDRNEELISALETQGIEHDWRLTEGDHSWPVWRQYLADFAPLLFGH
jgi:enterochelin esterase family protein